MKSVRSIKKSFIYFGINATIFTACDVSRIPKPTVVPPSEIQHGSGAMSCFRNTCVAVGQYFENGNPSGLPLAVFSNNNGQTFDIASTIATPIDFDSNLSSQLYGIYCDDSICVGAGYYNLDTSMFPAINAKPLVTFSDDYGKNFTLSTSPPMPTNADPAKLAALRYVTKSNTRLIAIGAYNLTFNGMGQIIEVSPWVTISDTDGKSFTSSYSAPLPNDAAIPNVAMLYAGDCVKQNCIVVGSYAVSLNAQNVIRPLIIRSTNGGQSFTTFPQISISGKSDTTKSMELRGITCEDLKCIAVGLYHQVGITGALPLVLLSDDGGLTFKMTSSVSLPVDADTSFNSQLKAVSCQGLHCVAGGFYNLDINTYTNGQALSLFSNDGGVTFLAASPIPLPADADSTQLSELTGVSCNDTNCIGVGVYNFNAGTNSSSPLAVFTTANQNVFLSASQPQLPINTDLSKSNTLGDIQP